MDRLTTGRLGGVISVDAAERTALVQGCCPMSRIVATLEPYGLMPLTTPAPAMRTVGGAVTRTSVGPSSFTTGDFAASVLELELLGPSGELFSAGPNGPHAAEFTAATSGDGPSDSLITAARVSLVEAGEFIATRQVGAGEANELAEVLSGIVRDGSFGGEPVEFCEAVSSGSGGYTISLGRPVGAAEAPCYAVNPSRYDRGGPPYASTLTPDAADLLRTAAFLTRWEADGFWRSSHYGLSHALVRRLWPARLRTPAVYGRIDAVLDGRGPAPAFEFLARWQPSAPRVFREIAVPLAGLAALLESLSGIVPAVPIWMVPYRAGCGAGQDDTQPLRAPIPTRPGSGTQSAGDDAAPALAAPAGIWVYLGIWGPGAYRTKGHAVGAESAIDRLAARHGGRTVRSGP
jgi:FAD/FMN-containing dehydrogenase